MRGGVLEKKKVKITNNRWKEGLPTWRIASLLQQLYLRSLGGFSLGVAVQVEVE
jgi:hypothetical protein